MWRRFEAEGTSWEVNATPARAAGADERELAGPPADAVDVADETGALARPGAHRGTGAESEVLEFRSADPNRPPRRLLVDAGRLARMDDEALRRALRQARPIGGDFYGRPGKRMSDTP